MIRQFPFYCTPDFIVDDGATRVLGFSKAKIVDGRLIRTLSLGDGTAITIINIIDGGDNDGWTTIDAGERTITVTNEPPSHPVTLHVFKPKP